MRKLAVTLALASTALATPAFARDNAWYVGVEGGAMLVEDIRYDITTVAGVKTNGAEIVDSEYGYDVDGLVGYDFGGFRLEAEVGYKSARVDSITNQVPLPTLTPAGALTTVNTGTRDNVGGKTTALSFMVNGLLDFGDDDGVQGFVGGGVGVARVKADNYAFTTFGPSLDDSDTVFAWQGLAGVRAPLSDHVDVTLKYRFFNADDVRLINISGQSTEGRFRSHSILGGLTYNFGEPAPLPVPLPLPPVIDAPLPPPIIEAPAPVCSPGPYIVFFEWDKSDITSEAGGILDDAVAKYQTCGNAQVMLAGHADRSGAPAYNVALSERRNASVQSYLTGHGIPGGVITTQAFGESRPRVETADGVREVQNRRVEIQYGPGSGM